MVKFSEFNAKNPLGVVQYGQTADQVGGGLALLIQMMLRRFDQQEEKGYRRAQEERESKRFDALMIAQQEERQYRRSQEDRESKRFELQLTDQQDERQYRRSQENRESNRFESIMKGFGRQETLEGQEIRGREEARRARTAQSRDSADQALVRHLEQISTAAQYRDPQQFLADHPGGNMDIFEAAQLIAGDTSTLAKDLKGKRQTEIRQRMNEIAGETDRLVNNAINANQEFDRAGLNPEGEPDAKARVERLLKRRDPFTKTKFGDRAFANEYRKSLIAAGVKDAEVLGPLMGSKEDVRALRLQVTKEPFGEALVTEAQVLREAPDIFNKIGDPNSKILADALIEPGGAVEDRQVSTRMVGAVRKLGVKLGREPTAEEIQTLPEVREGLVMARRNYAARQIIIKASEGVVDPQVAEDAASFFASNLDKFNSVAIDMATSGKMSKENIEAIADGNIDFFFRPDASPVDIRYARRLSGDSGSGPISSFTSERAGDYLKGLIDSGLDESLRESRGLGDGTTRGSKEQKKPQDLLNPNGTPTNRETSIPADRPPPEESLQSATEAGRDMERQQIVELLLQMIAPIQQPPPAGPLQPQQQQPLPQQQQAIPQGMPPQQLQPGMLQPF